MHFYDRITAKSAHEVVAKNGKMRPTTIADARKFGYFPSVSTVKELGYSFYTPDEEVDGYIAPMGHGLVNWLLGLLLDTVQQHNCHWTEYEHPKGWKDAVFKEFTQIKGKAATRGTEIHGLLDKYFVTGKVPKKDKEYIMPVVEFLKDKFHGVKWVSEMSFTHPLGFAGQVDLHSVTDNIVLDFKTKDKPELNKMMQYDDHRIQLSAYQEGLGLPENTKRYNLFVSVHYDTPGGCLLVE